jgi:molecular chaperone DnaJ
MAKDLYGVLGVARDASPDDLKKAYRKLSKEWHPDKHKGDKKAEDRFKEINEAYETLGDPDKRKQYDQFGSVGGSGKSPFEGMNFEGMNGMGDLGDLFESFFGGRGGRGGAAQRGADREVEVEITLVEASTGVRRVFAIERERGCETCKGSGAAHGASTKTCVTCNGTGQVTQRSQSFFGFIQQRAVCSTCRGSGKVPERPCSTCKGTGSVRLRQDVAIDVPAGIADGQRLRLRGEGDAGMNGRPAGDLFVSIRVLPDPRFERDGADLHGMIEIPAIDAILGTSIDVPTVSGDVTLKIPEGTAPGQIFRLRGKGLPVLGASRHGDHYVRCDVLIPKKLSKAERKILEEWRKIHGES